VYGGLPDLDFEKLGSRYEPSDPEIRRHGISEERPLDFESPYGCSKGCADQYVLDYARTFGIGAVVFRMSCIYGPRQFGNEDQGWVAHFVLRALQRLPLTLYGDGLQVRDVLFVDDLIDAFLRAQAEMDRLSGQAFNIGGGRVGREEEGDGVDDRALSVLMTTDTVGGVWTYALELSRALERRGAHVTIAAIGRTSVDQRRAAAGLHVVERDFRLEWMDDPWDDVRASGE